MSFVTFLLGDPSYQDALDQDHLGQLEADEQLDSVLNEFKQRKRIPQDFTCEMGHQLYQTFMTDIQSMQDYVPQACPGSITLDTGGPAGRPEKADAVGGRRTRA